MKDEMQNTPCVNGPKYVQVYATMKGDILKGVYPPNTYLPTEDELVAALQISKTTLRHAVALLRDDKLLEVQQGIGMKVLPKAQNPVSNEKYKHSRSIRMELLVDQPQVTNTTRPAIDIVPAEIQVASQLKLSPGELVNRVQRLQMVNDCVYGYIVDYIPVKLVPCFQMDTGSYFYDVLEKKFGMRYESAEEKLTAIKAGFLEARMLNVEIGSPLLMSKRIVNGPKGAFVYSEDLLNPEYFQLAISLDSFHQHDEKV